MSADTTASPRRQMPTLLTMPTSQTTPPASLKDLLTEVTLPDGDTVQGLSPQTLGAYLAQAGDLIAADMLSYRKANGVLWSIIAGLLVLVCAPALGLAAAGNRDGLIAMAVAMALVVAAMVLTGSRLSRTRERRQATVASAKLTTVAAGLLRSGYYQVACPLPPDVLEEEK